MEFTNRGNVPAPRNPLEAVKASGTSAAEVIFDAGNLSFVDGWVKKTCAVDTLLESGRKIGSKSQVQSKQRLGVGATAKRVDLKAEPGALEKKLLKKRQRQQEADAIASQVTFHGVAEDDEEGESKTSSFKGSKRGRIEQHDETLKTGRKKSRGKSGAKTTPATNEIASRPETDKTVVTAHQTPSLEEDQEDVQRRKARKREGQKEHEGKSDLEAEPVATSPISEENAAGTDPLKANSTEVRSSESSPRKRRRGWGKARSSHDKEQAPSDTGEGDSNTAAVPAGKDSSIGRNTFSREPFRKKKVRSRQKNIRKDKRPMDQRPAHLRIGGAEYSGRHLTEETMKALGLPESDPGNTSPTGPDSTITDMRGEEGEKEAVLPTNGGAKGSKQESASMRVSNRKSKKKSKYKNLALAPGVVM